MYSLWFLFWFIPPPPFWSNLWGHFSLARKSEEKFVITMTPQFNRWTHAESLGHLVPHTLHNTATHCITQTLNSWSQQCVREAEYWHISLSLVKIGLYTKVHIGTWAKAKYFRINRDIQRIRKGPKTNPSEFSKIQMGKQDPNGNIIF